MPTQTTPAAGQAAHTPTPWSVYHPQSGRINIGLTTTGDSTLFIARLYDQGSDATKEANAAFIARACNSHAALVEALEACFWQFEHNGNECPEDRRVLDRARAALQLAKEGTP